MTFLAGKPLRFAIYARAQRLKVYCVEKIDSSNPDDRVAGTIWLIMVGLAMTVIGLLVFIVWAVSLLLA